MTKAQRRAHPGKIPFWKTVGGYYYTLKWRGRWYYVGQTYREFNAIATTLHAAGLELERVAEPDVVQRLHRDHGRTPATLMDHLPLITPEMIRASLSLSDQR